MKGLLFIFSVLNWAETLESLRTGKLHPGQKGNTGKKIKNSPKHMQLETRAVFQQEVGPASTDQVGEQVPPDGSA